MKILKVRDLTAKSVTNFDIFLQMVFGGNPPVEFDPNKVYTTGDLVYITNNDGSITIMQANGNGVFEECAEPNWSEYTLTSVLERQKEMIEELTGIKAKISDQLYNTYTYVYTADTEPINGTTVTIDDISDHLSEFSYVEVYVDDKYIPSTKWDIAGDVLSFTDNAIYTTSDNQTLTAAPYKITIRVNEANSLLTHYVRRVEDIVLTAKFEPVIVPYPFDPIITTVQFDLYINGKYTPNTYYTTTVNDEGHLIINTWSDTEKVNIVIDGQETSGWEFTFVFLYSITNEMSLIHTDYVNTIDSIYEPYMLDLTSADFVNAYQDIKVFKDGTLVDADRLALSKGRITVKEEQYYFSQYDTIFAPIWSYVLMTYEPGDVRHNSQTTMVYLNDAKEFAIPFIEWVDSSDDFLVFNDGGHIISNMKWYIDGPVMRFVDHDLGLSYGDAVDFRLLNQDTAVKMKCIYKEVTNDGQTGLTFDVDLTKFNFIMVFLTTGMYFPEQKYRLDGKRILFNSMVTLNQGDVVQIIGFNYTSATSYTSWTRLIVGASSDEQTVFNNPVSDYNAGTDSLLIFNDKGQYIGERFYDVDTGLITLKGEPVLLGGYIEVIRFRNLDIAISTGATL